MPLPRSLSDMFRKLVPVLGALSQLSPFQPFCLWKNLVQAMQFGLQCPWDVWLGFSKMHLNKDIFSSWSWRVQSPSDTFGFLKIHTEKYFSQLIFEMWILHKCFLKGKEMTLLENNFCTYRTSYPENCLYLSDGLGLLLASIHHLLQCAIFAKANQA